MPSQIAHMLAGKEASHPVLDDLWKAGLSEPAFRLGCQGPDIFYHNRRTKPGAFLYGTRLHRRGWGTVLAHVRKHALHHGWDADHPGLAFLLGAASHGFLDRRAHPFVVCFSGWAIPGHEPSQVLKHAHAFFERILDAELWRKRRAESLSQCFWQVELPGPEAFPRDFWTAWADALHAEFPRLSEREHVELRLKHAVLDTKNFLAATSPSRVAEGHRAALHGAVHYVHPLALPPWDFLNEGKHPWPDPVTGVLRTESFEELFDAAVDDSRRALDVWTDPQADWETLIGNGSLNLPGPQGENSTPQFSQPWNFEEIIDREVKARLELP